MKTAKLIESQEIEIAKAAQAIEDDLDNLDLLEREAKHISDITKEGQEYTKRKIMVLRHLEKIERKKAQRDQKRLLFVILVYLVGLDPLRAMALCAMADNGFVETDSDVVA